MKNRTTIYLMIITLLICTLIIPTGCAKTTEGKVIEFRLGHEMSPKEPPAIAADVFANEVNRLSEGRYKVNVFPNGQIGGERDIFEQIREGAVDLGVISAAPLGSFSPAVNILQLPFLVDSLELNKKVSENNLQMKMLSPIEELNVKILKVVESGMRYMIANKPIERIEDLEGMKFRTPPNQFHMDIFNSLGAKATPTAYGEIYTALQNKAIDGLENDLSGITSNKFYEVSKNMTLTGHFSWPVLLIISDKTWDKVPEADRHIFEEAAQKALEANIQTLIDGEEKNMKILKDEGVKIISLSKEEREKFIEASKAIYEQYANTPEAQEYIKAVNELKGVN